MQKIVSLLFLIAISISYRAIAQTIFIGDEVTNRKLQWSDFKGRPDPNSPHHAVTTWYLSYEMEGIKTYGDSVSVGKLHAVLQMEPKESWLKKEKATDELLKHEQGHFYIGMLCLQEFTTMYYKTSFRKNNFDAKMKKLFQETLNKYHQLGIQYDKETDHSQNREAQQYWDAFFAKSVLSQ